jgi:hypothetical protein
LLKAAIDKNLENYKKLNYVLELMHIFLQQKNCFLISDLDLLIINLVKVSNLNQKQNDDNIFHNLTSSFMKIGEIILLSENVKFSIEKANILPSNYFYIQRKISSER